MFEPVDTVEVRRSLSQLAARAGLTALPRAALVGLIVLAVGALAITAWRLAASDSGSDIVFTAGSTAPSQPGEDPDAAMRDGSATRTVWVHVAGAVNAPGLFELPEAARVGDALKAAGGLRQDAVADAVNLARPLRDGEQVYVPSTTEPPPGAGAISPPAADGASTAGSGSIGTGVDINRATVTELDALPGVGPATAERIVADREANGPFMSPEDLMRVPGIGEKKFEAMAEMVVVR